MDMHESHEDIEMVKRLKALTSPGTVYLPDARRLICSNMKHDAVTIDVYDARPGQVGLWLSNGRDPKDFADAPLPRLVESKTAHKDAALPLAMEIYGKYAGSEDSPIVFTGLDDPMEAMIRGVGGAELSASMNYEIDQRMVELVEFHAAIEDELANAKEAYANAPEFGRHVIFEGMRMPLEAVMRIMETERDLSLYIALSCADGVAEEGAGTLTTLKEVAERESEAGFLDGVSAQAVEMGISPIRVEYKRAGDYSKEELGDYIRDHGDRLTLDLMRCNPELRRAAAGVIGYEDALRVGTEWFDESFGLLLSGCSRNVPACWGRQLAIEGGGTIFFVMEADAWDYTHGELPLFCAIAATEVGGGTCEFRDVMDNAGDAAALAKISAKGRFGDHEACMAFMTSIEPSAYSPDELDMLMDIKPELFGKESREKYPEVDAAVKQRAACAQTADGRISGACDRDAPTPRRETECRRGEDR